MKKGVCTERGYTNVRPQASPVRRKSALYAFFQIRAGCNSHRTFAELYPPYTQEPLYTVASSHLHPTDRLSGFSLRRSEQRPAQHGPWKGNK